MQGDRIATRTTELHRVAQLAWVQDGVVSPQAFVPRPQDKGELSLLDMGQTFAEALAAWRTEFPKTLARQCLTVSVGHFEDLGVEVYSTPTRKFPAHASAMFAGKTEDEVEVIAALLSEVATVRP